MLIKLLPESSIETAAAKTSIAQSVLTEEEFITMLIGFIIMMGYVLIQLLKYTVRSFKNKDNETLALGISIFLYGIFAMISIWTVIITGKLIFKANFNLPYITDPWFFFPSCLEDFHSA
jgi:uncharacterized protein YhhL (DUF1145 family)